MSLRSQSLSDQELEMLLEPRAAVWDRARLRAQLLVSLIAEAGIAPEAAARVQGVDYRPGEGLGRHGLLPGRTAALLEEALRVTERRHLLAFDNDRPPSARAMREVVIRHGLSRGVEGVSLERLRRTFARRAWLAGAIERELAQQLGLSTTSSLRRFLRSDPLWREQAGFEASGRTQEASSA